MDKKDFQKLQDSLRFLESRQRELKRDDKADTRAFDSLIRYLKKDMIFVFNLAAYDAEIIAKSSNTDVFIEKVKRIIQLYK